MPVPVHSLGRVGDIGVFVPFQHLPGAGLQRGRVFDPRVRPHAALDPPRGNRVRVDVGDPAVHVPDGQLVHAFPVAQGVKPGHQGAGVHGLGNSHQVAAVIDAAVRCAAGSEQVHRPGRGVCVEVPDVFVRQHFAQRQQRGQQGNVFKMILKIVCKVHLPQLPPPHRLPVQDVLHHLPGGDAGAADLMVAEKHVVQQRGNDVLHVVGLCASDGRHFPAGHGKDAVQPRFPGPVRQPHKVVGFTDRVFRVTGRQGKAAGPQVVQLQVVADVVRVVQHGQQGVVLAVYAYVFHACPSCPSSHAVLYNGS